MAERSSPSAPPTRPVKARLRSGASEPQGVAARVAALTLVGGALARRGGAADEAGAPGLTSLDPRDRAFAHALAGATLRGLGVIDRLLAERMAKPPPAEVAEILRLGAAEILMLRSPAFAAVSTAVALADRHSATRPFRGLVNAVLRRLDREGGAGLLAALPPEAALPDWLAARWRAAWGPDALARLAARQAEEPPTDITPRSHEDAKALAAELQGEVLPGGSVRVPLRGDPSGWPGFATGRWWVQDAAAAWPARLLDVRPGETALDLCAAPGGKTLQLAAAGAQVTALDRSAERLERLRANLRRTGLAAEIVCADAAGWEDARAFDGVLLDAPCSATGTFRRHPDVLWVARPADIAKLVAAQNALLDAAAARVKPGGRLVYCVCSLEPEEGEAQVAAFLARHGDFRLEPARPDWPGVARAEGGLRFSPAAAEPVGGCDGFFVVRFDRCVESKACSGPVQRTPNTARAQGPS